MIAQNFSRRCGRKGFSLLLLICATVDSKTEIPDQWLLYTVCLLLEKSEICCFLLTVKIWSMMKNVCCCIIWTSQATLTFSIWHCDQFDLDLLTDDECQIECNGICAYLHTHILTILVGSLEHCMIFPYW